MPCNFRIVFLSQFLLFTFLSLRLSIHLSFASLCRKWTITGSNIRYDLRNEQNEIERGQRKRQKKQRTRISDWNYLIVCIGMTPFIEPTNKTFIGKFFWVWSNKFHFIYLINPHLARSLFDGGYEVKCGKKHEFSQGHKVTHIPYTNMNIHSASMN